MRNFVLRWCSALTVLTLAMAAATGCSAQNLSPGLTMLEKDALCACRHFKKQNGTRMGSEGADAFCESIGFKHRWESMFPGRLELGIGIGGLRALCFKSKVGAQNSVMFVFRDFEHEKQDYYVDDDFFQKASMFGDEILADKLFGSPDLARVSMSLILTLRHYLGFDYHKHASAFVDEVLSRGKGRQPIFVGYSFGGSMAMMQSLRLESSFGITFSAHGVKNVAESFGYPPTTKRHINLVLKTDVLLGTQASKECVFEAPELYQMLGDTTSVLSDNGFVKVDSVRDCSDPV